MYLTLWTLRVSPLYVYRHFSRWLRTDVLGCAGTVKVATLPRVRTLDHANPRKRLRGNPAKTPKVATLPRVRALDHANPRKGLRGTPKNSNFTSRSRARPRQCMQRVAREPCGNPESCNFTSRSRTRPRQSTQRVARGAYMLLKRSNFTSRSCIRPRQSTQKVARGAYMLLKSNNFTSRSRARPRQSMETVARGAYELQLYLAFARSTTPIHGNGCAGRRKVATLPRVRAFDHANPWKGLRVMPKSCNFTSRSRARPRQSMARVRRCADMLLKRCNFTSRSRLRPRQSTQRVARQP